MIEYSYTPEQNIGKWEIDHKDHSKNYSVANNILEDVFKLNEAEMSGIEIYNLILSHPRFQAGVENYYKYASNKTAVEWYFTLSPLYILEHLKNIKLGNLLLFKSIVSQILFSYPSMKRIA